MLCPKCDRPVQDGHRFCGRCGQPLHGITSAAGPAPSPDDATREQPAVTSAAAAAAVSSDADDVSSAAGAASSEADEVSTCAADEVSSDAPTVSNDALTGSSEAGVSHGADDVSGERDDVASGGDDSPTEIPDLGDLPTKPVRIEPPLPEPTWAPSTSIAVADDAPGGIPVGVHDTFGRTTGVTIVQPAPALAPPATGAVPVSAPATTSSPTAAPTTEADRLRTDQMQAMAQNPPLFDGATDVRELPPGRDPFKLKLLFVFAFFGAVAAVMASAATVIDLRTSIPVDGIATGPRLLDELGTNLAVGGFVGGVVMLIGGLLACFGFRWGAGLAGGAGLAIGGWAAITIGLAELPISAAEATTRASAIPFTLKVTRDLGYWLVVASAALGVVAFLASLRSIRTGGHPPHNPWVAAVGAVAGVILTAGPLLPVGNADFSDNFRSTDTLVDLPTAYLAGRLVQLALIVLCVVVGLLIVRAYGLGLAAGGVSVAFWLWLSSLLELEPASPGPVGIAIGNFGADDTTPHAVTTVGLVLTVAMLSIAAVLATAGHTRHARR